MVTFTALQDVLLQCIAALLCDYDVVQVRFCCRQLHKAIKPPKITQLCPGTWRVPKSALPDFKEALRSALENEWTGSNADLQWSYFVDSNGEMQLQLAQKHQLTV